MMDRGPVDRNPVDRAYGVTPTPIYYLPPTSFTYAGTLAAGKVLAISRRDFSVLNDGANDIGNFSGEFPKVAGTNLLTYTDTAGSRTVGISVTQLGPIDTTPPTPGLLIWYNGTLAPGDVVEIDANTQTLKKNGVLDMVDFSGNFPKIGPGTNTITYADSAGSRTIGITVSRKDRSV